MVNELKHHIVSLRDSDRKTTSVLPSHENLQLEFDATCQEKTSRSSEKRKQGQSVKVTSERPGRSETRDSRSASSEYPSPRSRTNRRPKQVSRTRRETHDIGRSKALLDHAPGSCCNNPRRSQAPVGTSSVLMGFQYHPPLADSSPLAFAQFSSHNSSPCHRRLIQPHPPLSLEALEASRVPFAKDSERPDGMSASTTLAMSRQRNRWTLLTSGHAPRHDVQVKSIWVIFRYNLAKGGTSCTQLIYARSAARLC